MSVRSGSILLLLSMSLASLPAGGVRADGPSFRCDARLTRTEAAICADPGLSALDVAMVRAYRAALRDAARPDALRRVQRAWLPWRDSCGADRNCLTARYLARTAELSGRAPTGTDADLQDGRVVVRGPDGLATTMDVATGQIAREVRYPDGSIGMQTALFQQVVPPSFPTLPPGDMASWGSLLERDLLFVLERLLPPGDIDGYRAALGGLGYSDRILTHVRVIDFAAGALTDG